jgi:hypothetical protein
MVFFVLEVAGYGLLHGDLAELGRFREVKMALAGVFIA